MNAVEAMIVLNTVEQHHQLVLEKMRALKDTMSCLLHPENEDLRRALDRLRTLDEYFAIHLTTHLEEEETTLFPLLEKHNPRGSELVARLRLEHAEIRYRLEEFSNCLQVAGELEGALPRAVVNDLLVCGWELGELLDNHAHVETRAVHPCLARCLQGETVASRA